MAECVSVRVNAEVQAMAPTYNRYTTHSQHNQHR